MKENRALLAHLSMFGACAGWGLMAPVGKEAMTHGFDGITMVTFRVVGACLLFWMASLFAKKEAVTGRDKLMFIGAALFGLVCNQCCYTLGLSITSPINASIVTTSMPIFAMLLAALILKEPITGKKALGVLMGCSGALILILTSAAHASDKVGDIRGDLLCLFAQFSFALYLSLFNPLIRRYNVFTINKYMFSWATLMLLPFTFGHVEEVISKPIPAQTWWEVAYVVVIGTFLCYILTMIGQRTLRPTVVSVYNYVQPIVSVAASLLMGIGILKASHAAAVALVFGGVWLVTKSKSRRDMEAKEPSSPEVLQTQVEDQHAVAGNDGVA
jgi:drug/metabolite transporter (DMT)-like permease